MSRVHLIENEVQTRDYRNEMSRIHLTDVAQNTHTHIGQISLINGPLPFPFTTKQTQNKDMHILISLNTMVTRIPLLIYNRYQNSA